MYRVMIVDDELLSRVGLKSFIDWNSHGFDLVAECENGESAITKAKELEPDIIITDIKMPVMDGIRLIELLKDEGVKAKVLVLSAYNDFEFVKESMKLGADDYILKFEMEPGKFIDTLKAITKKIENEGSYLNKIYEDNIQILRDDFIKKLLFGMLSDERTVREQTELLRISLEETNLCCILIKIINGKPYNNLNNAEMNFFYSAVINTIEEVITNYGEGLAVNIENNMFAVLISIKKADEQFEDIADDAVLKRIKSDISQYLYNALNLQTNIYSSAFCESYMNLNEKYLEAIKNSKETSRGMKLFSADKEIYELNCALQKYDIKNAERTMKAIKNKIRDRDTSALEYIHGIFYIIVFMINSFCRDWDIEKNLIWNSEDPHDAILMADLPHKCRSWLETVCTAMAKAFNEDRDSKMLIIKAKLFIKKNYMKQLSLEEVAGQFKLSSNYFSKIFKDETGITFIDYLIHVRINKAKELIKSTDYKMYEICEMVGYDDPHYFSRVFKKVTGISPIEYK